ncbi:hypothetical protein B0J11DRAFT_64256 [Dendryphion nanum]|uniref:Uncharacterized protein n=1 Tax=Dendryphion nanum TaxID=256645 RepID=A0A9P9IGW2_9PLEO|nr:hypothetical protein B0J11DRAFT_64256 [Dendryphion nanum]
MLRSFLLSSLLPLVVLAAQTATQTAATSQQSPNNGYNGGEDNPQDPDEAGAAGTSKGAFNLSKGGLVAIIVVAVLVAVIGIASAVLFWLAKKRQWDVRQSIRRASRRFTGRADTSNRQNRQNRRTGVRLNSPPAPKNRTQNRDVEKGLPTSSQGKTTTTISSTFDVETPANKTWKSTTKGTKR